MKTDDFDFYLPEELIAQTPLLKRSESKLLVLNRKTNTIEHKVFHDIIDYLDENDILVLNNTKVIPARIYGIKEVTGAHIELLILKVDFDTILVYMLILVDKLQTEIGRNIIAFIVQ